MTSGPRGIIGSASLGLLVLVPPFAGAEPVHLATATGRLRAVEEVSRFLTQALPAARKEPR